MVIFDEIRQLALAVGLDDVGCAPAEYLEDDARFMETWLTIALRAHNSPSGAQSTIHYPQSTKLHYLAKNCDKRYDPRMLVPGTQTVLVGVLTFEHSGHDYHRTMKSKLYALEAALKNKYGEDIVNPDYQHIFCDSAPVLERRWAQKAGLGFIGKNHAFIHPQLGSLIHLGELFLAVSLSAKRSYSETVLQRSGLSAEGDPTAQRSACDACTKCIDACPRKVLGVEPWDVTRCIAYETNHCLICQNCCPYNEKRE